MLAIALALGASLCWGTGDFLGGWVSRRVPLVWVLLISQATGLIALTIIVIAHGADRPDDPSLYYAALAGMSEIIAIASLYRGLANGAMSLVAPIAALAPVLPLLAGLLLGEVPTSVQLFGLALAIAGVILLLLGQHPRDAMAGRRTSSVGYGVLAALGFGIFFITMNTASEVDIAWSLLLVRLTTTTVTATFAVLRRPPLAVRKTDLPAIALTGILLLTADSLYAIASTQGLLGIAAVLGSTHTIITVGLARIFLKEHLDRLQQIGITTAIFGVLLIATP